MPFQNFDAYLYLPVFILEFGVFPPAYEENWLICAIGCFTQNRFQNNKNIPMFTSGDIDFIGGNVYTYKII